MQFGTTQESIQDSGNAPFLNMPYIGRASLVDVYREDVKGKDGTTYENVLNFRFKLEGEDIQGNNVKGHIVEKSEWPPREDDDQDKTQNKLDRIGYIMKYFMPEEEAVIPPQDSWKAFTDQVLKRFEKNSDYSEVPIKLKVTGSVYKNQAQLQIPNYRGFIQGKNSEHSLSFSKKEMQDNRKYVEAQTMPDESNDPVMAGSADDDDLF